MDSCTGGGDSLDNADSMKMSYELLKTITDDFSENRLLGSGTFGMVYKGTNANGGKDVAVKVLRDMAALDNKKFTNEFQTLAKLNHQNIVQLVGYCNESEQVVVEHDGKPVTAEKLHVALCFEYVNNGSLGNHISDEETGLPWHIRYKIIKGICEGLKHLHKGLEKPVLHLDLKPDNILLDDEMTPKIADFGLSRLIGDERTRHTMDKSIGTSGYLAPEYTKFQLISSALDIFSLGVIITKIIVGREGYHDIADMPTWKLVKHVQMKWKKRLKDIVRARSLLEVYCQQMKTCIEVESKCLMEDRRQRPTIKEIIAMLSETDMSHTIISSKIQESHDGGPPCASSNRITSVSTSEQSNCSTVTPWMLSYKLLKNITDGFSVTRIIGHGSSGVVYQGVYEDGEVIAVKTLFTAGIDKKWWEANAQYYLEIIHHENIERLLGYCYQTRPEVFKHNGRRYLMADREVFAFCCEYYKNGSLERYISDEYCGLDWCTCYKVMKGTCDGLKYLHGERITHLHLKPSNIMLDENMTPKIGDFALAGLFGGERLNGPLEYLPPEYINKGVISIENDIFSFGITIIKMIAGHKGYSSLRDHDFESQEIFDLVLQKWRKRLQETSKSRSVDGYCQQVKRCLEIAFRCVNYDRHKRPDIGEVVRALEETETWIHDDSELLDVYPMELRFPFKPKKHASCLLQLQNKQDDHVAFRLVSRSPTKYFSRLPLCGIVPPQCTYTLALTTCKQPQRPPSSESDEEGLVLQSIAFRHRSYLDQSSVAKQCESSFKKAKEMAEDEMQEVTLKSLCALPQPEEISSSKMTRPEIEIISMLDAQLVLSIEVHPEKPWIMTTHQGGYLRIWNYHTMATVNPIELPDQPVYVAKFITREEWIVAGDGNGFIHVLSYDESQDDSSFRAHDSQIMSLAVHPTDSYVLSSSHDDHFIKLWHWDQHWDIEKGVWVCIRTFEGHTDKVSQVAFNPEEPGTFASASWDGTVKIWGLTSDACNTNTLDKHPDGLLCVDYMTNAENQHLITGSKDGTVQIWDLETKRCKEYLQGHGNHINVVSWHPELQKLITGSIDGTVRIWDSTKLRYQNIIAFNLGPVYGVRYIDDLQRIVVGCQQGIAMMDIKEDSGVEAKREGLKPRLPP